MLIARLFLKRQMPVRAVDEVQLLREARADFAEWGFDDLSTERLAGVARARGVDFATALFYDRARRSAAHGAFIRRVEAQEPDVDPLPRLGGKLLLVPATFYRELPAYGGDGLLIREIAARLAMEAALLPVPSGGSVRDGAALLRAALAGEPDRSVTLVSLSKGGADVRVALEDEAAARKVRAWISIGGLLRGFPLLRRLLADHPLRAGWRAVFRLYFAAMRANPQLAEELWHGPGTLLAAPAVAPAGVRVVSVIGVPLPSHLTGTLRGRHRRLAALGPNDGFTLLRDGIVEGGAVYPVWGANHYFRFPGSARLLYQLFMALAEEGLWQG